MVMGTISAELDGEQLYITGIKNLELRRKMN